MSSISNYNKSKENFNTESIKLGSHCFNPMCPAQRLLSVSFHQNLVSLLPTWLLLERVLSPHEWGSNSSRRQFLNSQLRKFWLLQQRAEKVTQRTILAPATQTSVQRNHSFYLPITYTDTLRRLLCKYSKGQKEIKRN